ncbi:MAG: hypothetical protein KA214_06535 [Neisseriaceae bacterium]|nr:hypothetical protein [Neisseriaceae bacterium]
MTLSHLRCAIWALCLWVSVPAYAWEICPGPSNHHVQRVPAPSLDRIDYTSRGSVDLNTQQTAYEIVIKNGQNGSIALTDQREIRNIDMMNIRDACNSSGSPYHNARVTFVPGKSMGGSGHMQASTDYGIDLTFGVKLFLNGHEALPNPVQSKFATKFGMILSITKIQQTGPVKGGGGTYQRVKMGQYKVGAIETNTAWDGGYVDVYLWIKIKNEQLTCQIIGSGHIRAALKPVKRNDLMGQNTPIKGGVSEAIRLSCPKNIKVAAILTDPTNRQVVSEYLNSTENNGVVFKLKRSNGDGQYLRFGPNNFAYEDNHQFVMDAKNGEVVESFDVYYAVKPNAKDVRPGPVSGRAEITFSYQ